LEHLTKTRVRYADTDQMGYVHHAKYLEYFEIGRMEYMRAKGCSYAEIEAAGFFLAVIETNLEYHKPARYGMELTIRSRVEETSHVQVKFNYAVENDGKTLCEGWTKLACIDVNGKPRRIPERLRSILAGRPQIS
jgi:acyl-CoA thioester hydrolase